MNGGVSYGLLPALLDPPQFSCLNWTSCSCRSGRLPLCPDPLYFSIRCCGKWLPIAGSVSRILAMTRGRKRDSPPRRVETRVSRELRYSCGPGSNLRDSRGTHDITSMRVQATSKIFSICGEGVSGLRWEAGERGLDKIDAYEADAVDFHGLF